MERRHAHSMASFLIHNRSIFKNGSSIVYEHGDYVSSEHPYHYFPAGKKNGKKSKIMVSHRFTIACYSYIHPFSSPGSFRKGIRVLSFFSIC